ncbi:hypothetical protein QP113_02975 [Lactobacillus mulieris]|uniref:hypothetical protein n=1 Tax=Lactobacillus mulieris TaxID=2508708 RepID=UPI0022441508|nr:hypothetical protein [Lactobacillus mulieris]MCW8072864.1 hypothetical protein [Lactobacillus mulieris]MDK6268463.1 hypothetical protein [Lactobacillus mulieris]
MVINGTIIKCVTDEEYACTEDYDKVKHDIISYQKFIEVKASDYSIFGKSYYLTRTPLVRSIAIQAIESFIPVQFYFKVEDTSLYKEQLPILNNNIEKCKKVFKSKYLTSKVSVDSYKNVILAKIYSNYKYLGCVDVTGLVDIKTNEDEVNYSLLNSENSFYYLK